MIDKKKLDDYFNMGINRLSIGIQSFDDEILKSLNIIRPLEKHYLYLKVFFDCVNIFVTVYSVMVIVI